MTRCTYGNASVVRLRVERAVEKLERAEASVARAVVMEEVVRVRVETAGVKALEFAVMARVAAEEDLAEARAALDAAEQALG